MEIILSPACSSLTGCLDCSLGYYIRRIGKKHFSQRSKHGAPPDGHWRFILACAQLAQNRLYISDIRVTREEVDAARMEAGIKPLAYCLPGNPLDANSVLYIKDR